MAITLPAFTLIDGSTAWACQEINVSYFTPSNNAATTTRIYMADSMHQDVDSTPSVVNTALAAIGITQFTMIDGATKIYVNDDMVTSIEPRTTTSTWIHLEGHWIVAVNVAYATVLTSLTT